MTGNISIPIHYNTNTSIGHVNNIPTMQFPEILSQNLYMLSLTEYVAEFRNNALWDTHALLIDYVKCSVRYQSHYQSRP